MYRINYDSFLLHDLQVPSEHGYYLLNPELTEEVNKVSELKFDINSEHPNIDKLERLVPNIVLKKNNKTIFKGRIIKEQQNMDETKQVTCESILAFLFDSVVRPYTFQGSPEDLFKFYVDNHNSQVDVEKQFKIGKTTGANLDNNEYINRSNTNYSNTYDEIQDKLLNIGGYFYVRYEDDGNYLDWVDDFVDDVGQIISLQTIEFGKNLTDITIENDSSNTYSVVIPLGAETEKEDGTKSRLTIESVNDGLDYLINETALNKYGWIVAPTDKSTWDDVTIASNLKTKGQTLLDQQGVMLKSTLELNAVDLNVVDGSIDSFEMYQYIRVQSTPHNISAIYLLTKKDTPLTKPDNMTITLGETKNTLTGIQTNDSKAIKEMGIIVKDYAVNKELINQEIDEIRQEVINNTSLIEQTDTQIRLDVASEYVSTGTFDEFRETTETQFTVQADGIEAKFSEMVLMVENVEGETQAQFRELASYIRGYQNEEGQPVLDLGASTSDIMLRQTNDRIQFLQSGAEVAYVSNNTLYITDGIFLVKLRVGNFGFIPRENNSLDFKKVTF